MKPIKTSLGPATVLLFTLPFLAFAATSADADPTATGMAVSILSATSGESREKESRDWLANPQDYKPDGLSDYNEDYSLVEPNVGAGPTHNATNVTVTDGRVVQ